MKTYALDFESYYDSECSITTLGPRGYFSHPSFDAYMVTVVGDDGYQYAGHPKDFDWSIISGETVVMHNASFDESLYLYGVEMGWYPKVDFECHCTADMVAYLGLPRSLKNASAAVLKTEITKTTRDNMKGKQWGTMTAEFKEEVTAYAITDSVLCLRLWQELSDQWPEAERRISQLNRKTCQRGLPIDKELLQKNLGVIKQALFDAELSIPWVGDYTPLSRKAFNEQCRKQGITPPASIAQDNEDADAWFAAHQQECPWARSVQSYRRINAFLRKLEAFDAGTMADGRYYGGLMYCGANPTARFSGSGGNLNLQNLPREEMFGVNFRHMIKPKDGHKLIVVDLSQIEVRTLCWLAKDEEALKLIAESEDIYHAFGVLLGLHDPANGDLRAYDKANGTRLRHKVKSIVLGCFEGDTLVLTNSGWKPMLNLQPTDTVWDGEDWVEHKGVICQGIQTVMRVNGVGATPDHEVLTEDGWVEWQEVHTNPSLMASAASMVNLPSWNGSITNDHGTHKYHVPVGGLESLIDTMSVQVKQLDAIVAEERKGTKPEWTPLDTRKHSPTITQDRDSLIGSQPVYADAITKTINSSTTTGGGVYSSTNLGEPINESFSPISLLSTDGKTEQCSSTGLITIRDTNPIISGSYPVRSIWETADPSLNSNQESTVLRKKSVVYDVSFAGPMNRYTIWTDAGPLIVANCGYGMGANKFSTFSGMELDEAQSAVNLYRERMKSVPAYWRELDEHLTMAHSLDQKLELELPSNRKLRYGNIKRMKTIGFGGKPRFSFLGKIVRNGQMRDFNLWGGILAENLSQGLARDIFADMMLRIDAAGFPIILHVHDEVVCEVPEADAESALSQILGIMHTPPDWIPNIPVAAEGHILDLYSK